jgi:outer membrane protein OmpA-like peptidoglycan-associated protein
LSSDIEINVNNQKQNIDINEFDEGRYKMVLPIGKVYNLAITKDLYSDYLFDFDLSQVVLFEDFEKDAELESMKTLLKINVEGLEKNETAEVTIINLSTDSKFSTTINTDFNGKAEAWLRKGDIYQINIIKPGYTMYNQTTALGDEELAFEKIRKRTDLKTIKNADFKQNKNITFDKKEHNEYEEEATALTDEENNHKRTKDFKITTFQITADETINKDGSVSINAVIQKLEEGVKMEIENINFATNSSALNSSSYNSLEMLVKTLKMNPDIRVEISAHTDNIGSKAYNMKLSDQRAASVASYLFNQGIARDRIISKGYGADMPIADNNTEEGRSKNRRVELKILGNN